MATALAWLKGVGEVLSKLLPALLGLLLGRKQVEVRQVREELKSVEVAREVERDIDRMPASAVHDELRKDWMR